VVLAYLAHDKKNDGEKPQFVLLEAIGKPVWDVTVDYDTIKRSLEYMINEYGKC
jgi:3-dehydroquinate synthetase